MRSLSKRVVQPLPNSNPKLVCPTCGKRKERQAKLCWKCYSKSRRLPDRFYSTNGKIRDTCPKCKAPKTMGCKFCEKCRLEHTHTDVSTKTFYRKGRPFRWISLTRGYKVAVDVHRFVEVASYNWFTLKVRDLVYACRWEKRNGKKTLISMHQQIMGESTDYVDHEDHDTLNNMEYNLRLADPMQSVWNRRITKRNTSGYIGVSWIKARQYYIASIMTDGNRTWLGTFDDPIEAAKAYDTAAKKSRGEFAHLNNP